MQWLEKDFLGYLDEWDKAVSEREGFTPEEEKRMTLSQETLEGLRMTGTLTVLHYCMEHCGHPHVTIL